jgi:hypothetical protein
MPFDPTSRARPQAYRSGKTLAELAAEHAEIPRLARHWVALQSARAARAAREQRRMTRAQALLAAARAVVERFCPRGSAVPTPVGSRRATVIDFQAARRRLRGR